MAFPDSFVDEVRRTADIVRVVSEHVTLRKMGNSWKGLCPFHQEKTPSFNVRADPALFHCFGCGAGGDVFKFLMLFERQSFPEAVESLARRYSIPVPENRYDVGPDRKERDEILAVMEAAAQHFERTLWTAPGTKAREYLLGRGFKKETLEKIRAGAARDSWDDLLGALKGRFSLPLLMTAGLVLDRQDRGSQYDRFRNRAVFPILNESGKVVAFGARSLDGSEPKYLNSPETPVYQKSRTLYGLSWAKEKIRQDGSIVLMEGYLDVARALEAGITEAVATCGTALTASHARLIHRFAARVTLNFDQDEAGQKAARKSFDVLLEEGLRVQVVELPAGDDPDTYLKSAGPEAYRERLAAAPEALDWLMARAAEAQDLSTPAGKAAYIEAILPTLAKMESAVEKWAWLRRAAERGGIDEAAARDEMKRFLAGAGGGWRIAREAPAVAATGGAAAPPPLLPAEKCLLSLLLRGAEGVEVALRELSEAEVAGLGSAAILRAAQALSLRATPVNTASLQSALAGDPAEAFLTAIAMEGVASDGVSAADCVRELKRQPLKARMAEIQKKLKEAPGEAVDALLQEKNRLASQMASL
jgi:DNA primase